MDLFAALGPAVVAAGADRRALVTRHFFLSKDAAQALAQALAAEVTGRRAVVLADARTARAAAEPCLAALRGQGFHGVLRLLPDRNGQAPVCDDITKDQLLSDLPPLDLLVGVGSGVVSDLSKWVAFSREIPSAVYATAASMNGYTAANVAPAIRGVKSLVAARSHLAVAADPEVLAAAPSALTAAGLGDVIAKWVSTADWRMNHLLFDEPYSDAIAGIIDHVEDAYLGRPEAIAARDPQAISALFKALAFSGCAMTLHGSSLPASGGEHLISHALDMRAAAWGDPHDLHGRQVGVGTILAAALYQRVLALEPPRFQRVELPLDRSGWGGLAGAVAAHLERKNQRLVEAVQRLHAGDTWNRLRADLAARLPAPDRIKSVLAAADAAHRIEHLGISRQRFEWAVLNGAQMRERFTSLDLAWVAGVLPQQLADIVECHGLAP